MNKKLILTLFVFCFYTTIYAQETNFTTESVTVKGERNKRDMMPDINAKPLFDAIASPTQHYKFGTDSITTILSENGNSYVIPKDAFVLENGKPYSGDAKIYILEAFTPFDIITNNLQTITSKGEILATKGMFYLDVKTPKGDKLKLKEDKKIMIDVASARIPENYKMYSGANTKDGNINWNLQPNQTSFLPFLTNPSRFEIQIGIERCEDKIRPLPGFYEPYTMREFKQLIDSTNNAKFKETYINTGEFRVRARQFAERLGSKIAVELLKVYLKNIDKSISYSDNICLKMLEEHIKPYYKGDTGKYDKTGYITYYSDDEQIHVFFSRTSLYEYMKLHQLDKKNENKAENKIAGEIQVYLNFKNSYCNKTYQNCISLKSKGLSDTATFEQIIAAGYSASDATDMLSYLKLQKQKKNQQISRSAFSSIVYTNKLGWSNIDKLMHLSKFINCDFETNIINNEINEPVLLKLYLPRHNCVIDGKFDTKTKKYVFNQVTSNNSFLPKNAEAILLGFYVKNGKFYFGKMNFKITEINKIDLEVKNSTETEITDSLKSLNK